jgi:hypothetical protein
VCRHVRLPQLADLREDVFGGLTGRGQRAH